MNSQNPQDDPLAHDYNEHLEELAELVDDGTLTVEQAVLKSGREFDALAPEEQAAVRADYAAENADFAAKENDATRLHDEGVLTDGQAHDAIVDAFKSESLTDETYILGNAAVENEARRHEPSDPPSPTVDNETTVPPPPVGPDDNTVLNTLGDHTFPGTLTTDVQPEHQAHEVGNVFSNVFDQLTDASGMAAPTADDIAQTVGDFGDISGALSDISDVANQAVDTPDNFGDISGALSDISDDAVQTSDDGSAYQDSINDVALDVMDDIF